MVRSEEQTLSPKVLARKMLEEIRQKKERDRGLQ
jgi:hypothetical protein